jgi:bacterioferritin-associated ferredoxin
MLDDAIRPWGGSRGSALGLTSIVPQSSDEFFTFGVGSQRYQCLCTAAEFIWPPICDFHLIDVTVEERTLDVDGQNRQFGVLLEAGRGGIISIESTELAMFVSLCGALWNSELCESICRHHATLEDPFDSVRHQSQTRYNISGKLGLVTSHFY